MTHANGIPVWFELATDDASAARDFYAAVAGWQMATSPIAEHGGYTLAHAPDGIGVAGLMTPPPGAPAIPGWSVYFGVDDVDAAASRIAYLGGRVDFGPQDIPQVGRFAVCADPQGVVFTIMAGAGDEPSRAFAAMPGAEGLGHGVWIELATPDPEAALAFYGALFGWAAAGAMPMGEMGDYTFLSAGEVRPGAVMSSATTRAPARWTWYVQVADIDAAVAAATSRGGTLVQGPDQIPGGDFSASLTDLHGHAIGLVGPRQGTR